LLLLPALAHWLKQRAIEPVRVDDEELSAIAIRRYSIGRHMVNLISLVALEDGNKKPAIHSCQARS